MKYTGKDIVDAIANRLDEEDIRCYDSAIIRRLAELDTHELNQLLTFGDVSDWHNDRILKVDHKNK